MKRNISKQKALQLIDEKIAEFEEILRNANINNIFDDKYDEVYYGTEMLLADLFSERDKMDFGSNVQTSFFGPILKDPQEELANYQKHIKKCIAQLKIYKEKVQIFGKAKSQIQNHNQQLFHLFL